MGRFFECVGHSEAADILVEVAARLTIGVDRRNCFTASQII
jgi:hypothetical protein